MQKIETYKVFQLGNTPVTIFCEVGPEADETHRSFLYARNYPEGTVVEITIPAQEDKIIMPDGMEWKNGNLYTDDGAMIASTRKASTGYTNGWYYVPHRQVPSNVNAAWVEADVIKNIENALAVRNYFGVKKIRTCEEKHTYTVCKGEFSGKTLTMFRRSCWTTLYTQFNAGCYPEGTTVKITYPETKPEVVYPGGACWDDEGNLHCCGEGVMQIGFASPDGGTAMYAEPSGYLHWRTASAGFKDQNEAKYWVVSQLAKHGHYWFRFRDK